MGKRDKESEITYIFEGGIRQDNLKSYDIKPFKKEKILLTYPFEGGSDLIKANASPVYFFDQS